MTTGRRCAGTVLLVDVANVLGSRPDGWWRDRAGATARLLERLATLPGRELTGPGGGPLACAALVAVVEGAARGVAVAVDAEVVPRGAWDSTELADGADVEIVRAIQGG